jgi:hypothetical protein
VDINVKVIPHNEQRYDTVGDWWFTPDPNSQYPKTLEIRVSKMGNPLYEFLVARHEQDEAMLCAQRGISEESVSKFDIEFETKRQPGDLSEPGDNVNAPYHREHKTATIFEQQMATELNVNWEAYDEAVQNL